MDSSSLGAAIRRRRELRGMTPYALAKRAAIADVYLRRIEAGLIGRIGVDVLLRLSEALGADPMDLLREAGWTQAGGPARGELDAAIDELDGAERAFLLTMSRALVAMRRTRSARTTAEPVAAYDRPFPLDEDWPEDGA